ncbi:MAG: response regulator [Oscillochloris sp.]|nr:response regulator [Oscillochloris sp.]
MKTILIVDDNFDNRTIIAQMLKLSGYNIHLAANGSDAIMLALQLNPDLIMMDLAMPGLDGWSASMQLKSNPKTEAIPIIAVTGHVTQADIQRALNSGCDDYLSKPIDYEVMIQKVQRHLAP